VKGKEEVDCKFWGAVEAGRAASRVGPARRVAAPGGSKLTRSALSCAAWIQSGIQ